MARLPLISLSLALAMTSTVPALADPVPAVPAAPTPGPDPSAGSLASPGLLRIGSFVIDPLRPAPHTGELTLAVKRLSVVGSVLYVAAHPDDENTRLLSWLVGERGLAASYVSLTRGDGGQNLIGEELGPLLGLIRTHELLAARRIDGAAQYFTRAVDFGYSKSAEETLRLWDGTEKDAVLSDLVRVVRLTRPDVIVTRFSTEPPNHGHHIASALMAREAFVAAADPARFPRQREDGVEAHRATRLFENKSHWRFKEGEDLSKYHQLDVGAFSPLLGKSFAELAAASRTMHKSQGFGSAPTHGPQPEYFELVSEQAEGRGSLPNPVESRDGGPSVVGDPLAGLDFTWRRFPRTEKVIAALAALDRAFDPRRPAASVPALLAVRNAILALPSTTSPESGAGLVAFYREKKLHEIDRLLVELTGLYLDARSPSPLVVPGERGKVSFTAWARSGGEVSLTSVRWPDGRVEAVAPAPGQALTTAPKKLDGEWVVPKDRALSTPFWLREPRSGHLFATPGYLGVWPEGPPDVAVTATLHFKGGGLAHTLEVAVPVRQSWVDPVHGERFRPVEVLPPVTVTPRSPTLVLPNAKSQRLAVQVAAHGDKRAGRVAVVAPAGWTVKGEGAFELEAGGETELSFEVTPPSASKAKSQGATRETLRVVATVSSAGDAELGLARRVIDHTHIPTMTVLSEAKVTAVVFPFEPGLERVGYVVGPGDEVMRHLAAVGYEVTPLTVAELARADLSRFQAIVVGVRAFNQEPTLVHQHARLMDYVQRGGTYLVQYQVSSRFRPLGKIPIGPAPFSIAQGRVTDEGAAVSALDPAIMARPNRLENQDFEGWVQERGLYFAETWDKAYTPLLSMADPGEESQAGAVIAMRHGKGVFIYTGLSFFRQLPEGVPGAYRLFANLLRWGKK